MARFRSAAALLAQVLVAAAALDPHVSVAGWSPDGVTVRATDAPIPLVSACGDGESGTFVAWHEATSDPSGVLRIQHLLASGDPDPAWPADGVLVSGAIATRQFIKLLPDHVGGVYVCWVESGGQLMLTHLDPGGEVAAGWSTAGTVLGSANPTYGRPRVIDDGAGGLYVAWSGAISVFVRRFGPDGLGTGGWPNAARIVSPGGPVNLFRHWPGLALAADGGVFVSWATRSTDTTQVPSGLYLRRLTGAGLNSPGWPIQGMVMGSFLWELLGGPPLASLIDIAPDGRGGVFAITGELLEADEYHVNVDVRLRRLMADGQPSPGWPTGGRTAPWMFHTYEPYWLGPDHGLRVDADGQDGAIVGCPYVGLHGTDYMEIRRGSDTGQWSNTITARTAGHELVVKGDGGVFMAGFNARGPSQPYEPYAFIGIGQSNAPPGWTGWGEVHYETSTTWYGDIGLAPAGAGGVAGVVFFWSQVRERHGLFARWFTNAGQVTSVDGRIDQDTRALVHLRFVAGTGVVARVAAPGPSRLELFDVGGRQVSARSLEGRDGGAVDAPLPGTVSLRPGIYFGRLAWDRSVELGKVAVVR